MYQLNLCQTKEYSPRLIEHWLHTQQNAKKEMELYLVEENDRIKIICSEDLSKELAGSRSIPVSQIQRKAKFHVHQSKGSLLPIKRHAQFEDRINKERIYPMDTLIKNMPKDSFIRFKFIPVSERIRRRTIKKSKTQFFKADRRFDQWESKGWFQISWRRIFGPIIRKIITKISNRPNEIQEQTESLHEREDPSRAVLDKLSRPLFRVKIEMSHPFQEFIQGFSLPYLGQLRILKKPSELILSAEELASIISPPNPKACAANLQTESTAYFPAPKNPLKISEEDRKRHLLILGKTGMGKSTALLHLLKEDIEEKRSIVLLDPHGDLVQETLKLIPPSRQNDVILIDPANTEFPLALNPLELKNGENPSLKASALIEMFKVLAKGSWGPRMEYILRNTLLTLILLPNTTLLDLPRIYTGRNMQNLKDQELLRFWKDEFFNLDPKTRKEHISPILNKVGPILTSPLLRNIFGQATGKFQFDRAIDEKKIVLITLSKGLIGEDASSMLGMIFISMIQSALLRRASRSQIDRSLICLTIDEFQNFATTTLNSMLSESRKYGLALTLANQYLNQVPEEIRDSVLGNVGSQIIFRTSYQDAKELAPALDLTEEDLTNLAPFTAYAKLLKFNQPLALFRWDIQKITSEDNYKISTLKTKQFGRRRALVEAKLKERYNAANSICA